MFYNVRVFVKWQGGCKKSAMDKSNVDMCHGPLFKKIVLYTIPIIMTGILQLLFNAADLVVVGRYCGSVSVASVGATGSVINLIVNLFIGLSVGTCVTVAHARGAKEDDDVHRAVHTAIPTAFIGGVLLTIVGLICAEPILDLMGTPSDVIGLSTVYMKIYFCGMPSSMLYNFGASILRAGGDTRSPFVFLSIAGVVNVLLNLFFVRVLHLDVAGVALATAISQTLSAVLVLRALMLRQDSCRLSLKKMRIHKKQLLKMTKIGLPAGIQGAMFSISNVIIQSSINSFGSVVMSGNSAASNIEGFVHTTMNSFHQTAINFTGVNYGAKQYKRINRITLICLLCVMSVGLFAGVLIYTFARPLLSIYITDSAKSIEYGILRMTFICLPYFICGLMDVMTGVIRGLGHSLVPMLITVLGVCGFRVLWIFTVFKEYHTLKCLYLSYPISWAMTFIAQLTMFIVLNTKNIRTQHKAEFLSTSPPQGEDALPAQ